MRNNGYGKSLFDTEDGECFICGYVGDTARHEIIHGADRTNAKKYGLWIAVCPRCHARIHAADNGKFYYLKQSAQLLFENEYSHTKFMSVFMKNYL